MPIEFKIKGCFGCPFVVTDNKCVSCECGLFEGKKRLDVKFYAITPKMKVPSPELCPLNKNSVLITKI